MYKKKRIHSRKRRKKAAVMPTNPWYKATVEYVTLGIILIGFNVAFSKQIDLDEYQRMGGSVILLVVDRLFNHFKNQ